MKKIEILSTADELLGADLLSATWIELPSQLGCLRSGSSMCGLSDDGRSVTLLVYESSSHFAQPPIEDVVLGGSALVLCSYVARINQLRFQTIA